MAHLNVSEETANKVKECVRDLQDLSEETEEGMTWNTRLQILVDLAYKSEKGNNPIKKEK